MKTPDTASPYTTPRGRKREKVSWVITIAVIAAIYGLFAAFIYLLTPDGTPPSFSDNRTLTLTGLDELARYDEEMKKLYRNFSSELYVNRHQRALNIGANIGKRKTCDIEDALDVFEVTAPYFAREDVQAGINALVRYPEYNEIELWVWGKSEFLNTQDRYIFSAIKEEDVQRVGDPNMDGFERWSGVIVKNAVIGPPPDDLYFTAKFQEGGAVIYEFEEIQYTDRSAFIKALEDA